MKQNVEEAFIAFDNGKRPKGYKKPRHWYVLNKKGSPYPAKAIWALATEKNPGEFNTRVARIGLTELEYSLIDSRIIVKDSDDFDKKVEISKSKTSDARKKKLQKASKKPKVIYILTKTYQRNPDVVAEVLHRANGHCEVCCKVAPFKRKSNFSPYLEVHHKKMLSDGGEDTLENSIAICPNCHRQKHFG